MKLLPLLVALSLSLSLPGQQRDSLPGQQLSFSLNIYTPVGTSRDRGAFFDVEGRFHRNFSWLASLGYQGGTSENIMMDSLSLDTFGPPLPPGWPTRRDAGVIDGQTRWFYLGAGGQINLRIASGDLALGGLLTVARQHYRQLVSYGSLNLPTIVNPTGPDAVGPPRGLFGTANIIYRPVVQLGGRFHMHYSWWFSRSLAVRAGIVLNYHGFSTWGPTRSPGTTSDRYEVRQTEYSTPLRPGIDNYGLPGSDLIGTPDPTRLNAQATYLLGVIYKPAKYAPR